MRYRKKPIEVEAVQFTPFSVDEIERLVGGDAEFRDGVLVVATLKGRMTVNPGDWIIRGDAGEFHTCKPAIFAATYEAVE